MSSKQTADEAASGQLSEFAKMAKEVGLPLHYTNEVFDMLVDDMLLTMRGRSPELDAKIKQAWVERYAKKNPNGRAPIFVKDGPEIAGTTLAGPPGHGKTSVMRAAAKYAAELVGLKFVDNPDEDQVIDSTCYVFLSLEFAGVNSALQIKGIPYKKKVQLEQAAQDAVAKDPTKKLEVEYMSYLKDYSLSLFHRAGGGTLLLDDLLNATPEMINVALPLTEEKRFAGTHLGKVYVGATGNLGARDGTKTSGMSRALSGRQRTVMVRDSVDDIIKRMRETFTGEEYGQFGTMYFDSFLRRNGAKVIEELPTNNDNMGGYGSPRTLMKAMNAHFYEVAKVGGRAYAMDTIENMPLVTGSFLGEKLSKDLVAYMHSAYQFADPAASLLIDTGEIHDQIKKNRENALGGEEQTFFFQFAEALAEYSAIAIKKGRPFKEVAERFATGLHSMDGPPFGMAMDLFKDRVLAMNPQLALQKDKLNERAEEGRLSFDQEHFEILGEIIMRHPDIMEEKKPIITSILSEAAYFEQQANFGGATRGRSSEPTTPTAPTKRRTRTTNP